MKQTRRTYGTGSLRHLGGDRYRFECRADDGARLSRVFTARNRTEAEKATGAIRLDVIAKHEHKRDAGGAERAVRQQWTVERYCSFYMETWAPYHLADTTRARRQSIFTHNVCPHIGKLRMSDVTPSDLTRMYAALASPKARKRGGDGALSGSTIVTVHNHVRALFTFAVEEQEDFPTNPAARKKARPKVDATPRDRQVLTEVELRNLVDSARKYDEKKAQDIDRRNIDRHKKGKGKLKRDDWGIYAPLLLSVRLGTRRGETVALRWSDVNWQTGEITVRRALSHTYADGLKVKGTKTGKQREIPLGPGGVAELKRIQREQRKARLRFGAGWRGSEAPDDDYIVTERDGAPMSPGVLGARFRTFCEQEHCEHITLHLLRHSWVSQMIALGFDSATIAAMAGHSKDVLDNVYAHALDARKREAMEAFDKMLRAAK